MGLSDHIAAGLGISVIATIEDQGDTDETTEPHESKPLFFAL
jgi:hypothetical protein